MSSLRIGFVPEHFSTPLAFANQYYNLTASLVPYPSGTGSMVTALQSSEIDIAVGLTEGWVAALGKAQAAKEDAGFKLVGTYVETPLLWSISTGAKREDVNSVADLKGKKVGVSRIGSGSYIMSYVLADQQGWLQNSSTTQQPQQQSQAPFPPQVLNTFAGLREGVNNKTADFFMWEYFTTKKYYDNGEIKRVGEIYTPWSSWKIVAKNRLLDAQNKATSGLKDELEDVLVKINKGVKHFNDNQEEAVKYISTKLDYSEADAREWLKTVKFATDVRGVTKEVVDKTVATLEKAGVLGSGVDEGAMIALVRT